MIQYDFIEASFDSKNTDTCKLSILAGMDSFAFMVQSAAREVLLARKIIFEEGPADAIRFGRRFNELMQQHDALRMPYGQVKIAWFGPVFTLIPNRLFQQSAKAVYFRHLSSAVAKDDVLLENALKRLSATGVFPINKGLDFLFSLHYPDSKLLHFSTAFIDGILSLPVSTNRPRLFVYVMDSFAMLTLLDGSQLKLHNYFNLTGENDLLYYCLLVMKQFGLNPDSDPVYLAGQIDADKPAFSLLAAYISGLHFINHRFSATFGPKGIGLPVPLLFDLLCVAQEA